MQKTSLSRRASKEALRRGALPNMNFNDFHNLGANILFMPVSTEQKKNLICKNWKGYVLMAVNLIDTGAGIWSMHRIHPGSIVELDLPGANLGTTPVKKRKLQFLKRTTPRLNRDPESCYSEPLLYPDLFLFVSVSY